MSAREVCVPLAVWKLPKLSSVPAGFAAAHPAFTMNTNGTRSWLQ